MSRSNRSAACRSGTTRVWPGLTGKASGKATADSLRAPMSPAAIRRQNGQGSSLIALEDGGGLLGSGPATAGTDQLLRRTQCGGQEGLAASGIAPRLDHQRLAQRVMGTDQILVAAVKSGQVPLVGHGGHLASLTAVTGGTGQHQVPDLIEIHWHPARHQREGEEMIDVGQLPGGAGDHQDRAETVEAVALLVAVQGRTDLGDRTALPEIPGISNSRGAS